MLPAIAALLPLLASSPRSDADALEDAWRASGMTVQRDSLFVERGRPRLLRTTSRPGRCASVAVLGPRASTFQMLAMEGGEITGAYPSELGVAFTTACGDGEPIPLLQVEGTAPREVLEIVVATGAVVAVTPSTVLASRVPTSRGPLFSPPRAKDQPLPARVEREAAALTRWGALEQRRRTLTAPDDGALTVGLELPEGCHRLALLPHDGDGTIDLDAEATRLPSGDVLDKDRSEGPDAHLAFCLGEPSRVSLTWHGVSRSASVELVAGMRPLEPAVPARWGPRGTARASEVLGARRLPEIERAIAETRGGDGLTLVPIELDAGACYLVLGAHIGGTNLGLLGSLLVDGAQRRDGGRRRGAFALTACPRRATRTVVRVEAHGPALTWGLSVHRLGRRP